MPMGARCVRRWNTPWRAGSCAKTSISTPALVNGKEQDALPFPVTLQVLERGQERYNVYCTPCHSRVGNGQGMIVERGYKPAGNYHDAKRLAQPLSHYFFVMTNGYGAMPDYSAQLTPADRWAVAAYIRALQLSQNAKQSDVPQGARSKNLTDIAQQEGLAGELCRSVADGRRHQRAGFAPRRASWRALRRKAPALRSATDADPKKNSTTTNAGSGESAKPPASN